MNPTMFDRAMAYAIAAHQGQKRNTGEDFISHPAAVVRNLVTAGHIYPEMLAAAWLHDVVEDCGEKHIDLIHQQFGTLVHNLVMLLTRGTNEDYFDYIMRITKNEYATRIKIYDLQHNISTWQEKGSLKDKWRLALYVLSQNLALREGNEHAMRILRQL